jgi:hypothetical protein
MVEATAHVMGDVCYRAGLGARLAVVLDFTSVSELRLHHRYSPLN